MCNAFNALNWALALQNVLHLCPSFVRLLVNNYSSHSSLFIDADCLLSKEGTTIKSVLLVRREQFDIACQLFEGSVRTDGITLLGSPIGTEDFMNLEVEKERLRLGHWIWIDCHVLPHLNHRLLIQHLPVASIVSGRIFFAHVQWMNNSLNAWKRSRDIHLFLRYLVNVLLVMLKGIGLPSPTV